MHFRIWRTTLKLNNYFSTNIFSVTIFYSFIHKIVHYIICIKNIKIMEKLVLVLKMYPNVAHWSVGLLVTCSKWNREVIFMFLRKAKIVWFELKKLVPYQIWMRKKDLIFRLILGKREKCSWCTWWSLLLSWSWWLVFNSFFFLFLCLSKIVEHGHKKVK